MTLYLRGKSWYYDFRYRGERYVECLGPISRTAAQRIEREKKAEVAEGRYRKAAYPQLPKPTLSPKLKDFVDEFLSDYRTGHRPESIRTYTTILKTATHHLGEHALHALSPRTIARYRAERAREGVGPARINAEVQVIRQVLTTAVRWEILSKHPLPTGAVPRLRINAKDIDIISQEDEQALLMAAPLRLRYVITVGLNTGMRRGELSTLTWAMCDWSRREIRLTAKLTKSRKGRTIPMNTACHQALTDLRAKRPASAPLVFGYADIAGPFCRAAAKAGLPWLTTHLMRHTFATRALERGVDLHTLQQWLGHAKITQTERYLHLSSEHGKEAIERLVCVVSDYLTTYSGLQVSVWHSRNAETIHGHQPL